MQCGIDPKESFISSCSFMCHRSLSPSLLQGFTIPVHISQVYVLDKIHLSLQSHPTTLSPVTIVQVMDFSICDASSRNTLFILSMCDGILRFVLGAALLILAVTQTLKQSVNMYKATKHWQPNRYMQRLMKDGILYFLVCVSVPPPLSFGFVTITFSHPSSCQVFGDKLITWVFSFELLGTCFSVFMISSKSRIRETTLQCSSWPCFLE